LYGKGGLKNEDHGGNPSVNLDAYTKNVKAKKKKG
jgi:hypothetical protein